MDNNIELQKIQLLKDWFQAWFNIAGSIIAGGFIGLGVMCTTLYYGNPLLLLIIFLFLLVVFGLFGRWYMNKQYDKFLTFVDNLYMKIEKGETLPSIM